MEPEPIRITGSVWDHENGDVVFLGEGGARMRMPIPNLFPLVAHARRIWSARELAQHRPRDVGGWTFVRPTDADVFRVHTMSTETGDACVLLIDPGTDRELQLSVLNPATVRELGEALIEAAGQMSSKPMPRG